VTGPSRVIEGDPVDLMCGASKYNFTQDSLVWYKQTTAGLREVTKHMGRRNMNHYQATPGPTVLLETPSKFDIGKRLRFQSVLPEDSGVYVCQAKRQGPKRRHNLDSSTIVERQMELKVQGLKAPEIYSSMNMNQATIFVQDEGEGVEMRCNARGYPLPKVEWFLNDSRINFAAHPDFLLFDDGQSLRIAAVVGNKNEGKFTCRASSRAGYTELHQLIMKVEAPEIFKTDMFGSDQMIDNLVDKVVEEGAAMNLTCQATGKPRPSITWTFNNLPVNLSTVRMVDHNQTLIIDQFRSGAEGRYECVVSNLGGSMTRYQWVQLRATDQQASLYGADIAVPVFIAVGSLIVLAVLCLAIAKICLSTGRWNKAAPPTPPTPRMTQFDLDQEDQETESCRLTVSRDGSPYTQAVCHGCNGCSGTCHQCSQCHYNYNGLYGCNGGALGTLGYSGHHGGSIMGVRSVHTPVPRLSSPTSSLLSPELYTGNTSFGQNTLPVHRMDTLRREMAEQYSGRRSASPRINAEL